MSLSEQEARKLLGDKYPKVISMPARPAPVCSAAERTRGMNRTEAAYSRRLDYLNQKGEILNWRFEALTFRLAYRCSYTPDFLVITPSEIQIHEIKGGYVREDGLIKWKLASESHPEFRFFLCQLIKNHWKIQEYKKRR